MNKINAFNPIIRNTIPSSVATEQMKPLAEASLPAMSNAPADTFAKLEGQPTATKARSGSFTENFMTLVGHLPQLEGAIVSNITRTGILAKLEVYKFERAALQLSLEIAEENQPFLGAASPLGIMQKRMTELQGLITAAQLNLARVQTNVAFA